MKRGVGWGSSLSERKRAAKQYLELVREIPEVVEVRLLDDDDGPAVWTIISATPFDDGPRNRVLNAQIEVVRSMDKPWLGFRLINVEELDNEFRKAYISGIGAVMWSR